MTRIEREIMDIMSSHVSAIMARSILTLSIQWSGVDIHNLSPRDARYLTKELRKGLQLYLRDPEGRRACITRLTGYLEDNAHEGKKPPKNTIVKIIEESDIVRARVTGRDLCAHMGFSQADQIKVATAVSELARNIVQYANEGEIALTVVETKPVHIQIVARDVGPGIENLDIVLDGHYESKSGMGIGLRGTRNLMDEFDVQTKRGAGTLISVRKYLKKEW